MFVNINSIAYTYVSVMELFLCVFASVIVIWYQIKFYVRRDMNRMFGNLVYVDITLESLQI